MMRRRGSRLAILGALLLFPLVAGAQDAVRREWDQPQVQATAVLLDNMLDSVSVASPGSSETDQRLASMIEKEVEAAAAELNQLAAMLRAGSDRQETRALFGKLAARRLAVIELARRARTTGVPKEQVEAAEGLWQLLASYYRSSAYPLQESP